MLDDRPANSRLLCVTIIIAAQCARSYAIVFMLCQTQCLASLSIRSGRTMKRGKLQKASIRLVSYSIDLYSLAGLSTKDIVTPVI